MKYVMSLDQGTTSCRAILFDQDCRIVGVEQQEFTQIMPRTNWVEHNALEILETQVKVLQNLLGKHPEKVPYVECIGITNQRETIVVWDEETGVPYYNAIVWQDQRTNDFCLELINRGFLDEIREKTGLVIDSYFSASKVRWLIRHLKEKEVPLENILIGTIDSWLLWNLSEEQNHYTDFSNASRTMLFNINDGVWDEDLLDLFEVPRHVLP
ncbi:MAG: FGGY family carbohydrate kinase, partial [Flavobacteriales bacterium]|nr:FGGY family carbohydrate kinase [Flavobacteriales bacterium]